MPLNRWMDKENVYTHTHTHTHTHTNGILLSHKNKWNLDIFDNMVRPRVSFHSYVESKKMKQMNKHNKTEQTHRYREQIGIARGEGGGQWVK